jgi:hypothetical protein
MRFALVALAFVLLATACGSGKPKVYVQGAYKPTRVVLGAGTPIKDVRWVSYGGSTARAHGMLAVNDCQPTCAAGHVTLEPISFSVTYIGPCKSKRSYRLISIPTRGVRGEALSDC